jgi:hypothetical protein
MARLAFSARIAFDISQKSRENNSIQCDEYYNKYKDKQIGLMKFIFENIKIQQFIRLYRFHRLNNVVFFLKGFWKETFSFLLRNIKLLRGRGNLRQSNYLLSA